MDVGCHGVVVVRVGGGVGGGVGFGRPCVRWPLAARWWHWFEVPTWMWAATAWWWLMAVVCVVSRRQLDLFGVCLSVSALADLRFFSPSVGRNLHRRVGPLPTAPIARLAPGGRTEFVSRPAAGPVSSRARQQDLTRLMPDSRTELVSCPTAGQVDGS